jgi:hypothetical protein
VALDRAPVESNASLASNRVRFILGLTLVTIAAGAFAVA